MSLSYRPEKLPRYGRFGAAEAESSACGVVGKGRHVRVCATWPSRPGPVIGGPKEAFNVVRQGANKDRESFYSVLMDTRGRLIGVEEVSRGTLNEVAVHPRELFKSAILSNAASMIIAHNHPSGDSTPSEADIELTKRLVENARMIGIPIRDHIVLTHENGGGFYSMRDRGYRDINFGGAALGAPLSRGKKIAIGTGVLGALIAGAAYAMWRVRGADDDVAAANKRAKDATGVAASYKAKADAAGRAARATADAAGQAIAQANAAVLRANGLAQQAAGERESIRRQALEHEAAIAAQYAGQLQAQARTAQELAAKAQAEAVARGDAEGRARAAADQARADAGQARTNAVPVSPVVDSAGDLERKRQAVVVGFEALREQVARKNPTLSKQQVINVAAAFAQKNGIVLDKPDLTKTFWRLPAAEIERKVTATINLYVDTAAPVAKAPLPGDPGKASPSKASVTTIVDSAKVAIVQSAWLEAIAYAIDVFQQRRQQVLTSLQAFDLIKTAFQLASVLSPGAAAVPVPSALSEPSPFWANPVDVIRASMNAAIKAAQKEVDFQVTATVLALTADKTKTVVVSTDKLQPGVTAREPLTGKILPVAKAGVAGAYDYRANPRAEALAAPQYIDVPFQVI